MAVGFRSLFFWGGGHDRGRGFASLFGWAGGVGRPGDAVGNADIVFSVVGVSYTQPATAVRRFTQDVTRSNVQSANRRNLPE
jgi:hypothetical protein